MSLKSDIAEADKFWGDTYLVHMYGEGYVRGKYDKEKADRVIADYWRILRGQDPYPVDTSATPGLSDIDWMTRRGD